MKFVSDPIYTAHLTSPGHPERPERVKVINIALEATKLKTPENSLTPRKATEKEITSCHTKKYFDLVKKETSDLEPTQITSLSTGDVEISSDSFDAALYAAGGVLTAIDHVMSKAGSPVYCIVRPPGHHATPDRGMGFCLFNNIAIGARYAQKKYQLQRVLIVDWDVHHGNGTQDIFYNDPTVFYMSTHEKDLYPMTGRADETGKGLGKGTTLNFPIEPTSKAREEVLEAFDVHLRNAMKTFKPELVLISAGFDGHVNDPLGHFNLIDDDFYRLTVIVKEIANEHAKGRLVSVLEGGYDLRALASASLAHAKALL